MADIITAEVLFKVMIGVYSLRLCNILIGATAAAWQKDYNKEILILGFIKQLGFVMGIMVLFLGATILPAQLFVIDIAGQSLGLQEIVFVLIIAYGTVSIKDFVEKAMELQSLKLEDQRPSAVSKYESMLESNSEYLAEDEVYEEVDLEAEALDETRGKGEIE